METKEFLDTCKEFIRNYLNGLLPDDTQHVSIKSVLVADVDNLSKTYKVLC